MLRVFIKILIFLLAISAFITPFAVYLCDYLLGNNTWIFSRIYDRVALAVLISLVVFYRKELKIKELKQDFDLFKEKSKTKKFSIGFLVTLVPVLLILPVLVAKGDLSWKSLGILERITMLVELIPTFLVVSFLEELVFRIFLFWTLRKRFNFTVALLSSAAFYSFVHFIAPVKSFHMDGFDIFAGVEYYGVVAERIASFHLLSAVISLLLIGCFLAIALTRSQSLFLIAGLHAGWIASIKIIKYFTHITTGAEGVLTERYYLLTLPLAWVAIAVSILLGYYFSGKISGKES